MSFQAMTWAIEQKAGSPSAKATLLSIANYANNQDVAWPAQKLLADESEQSEDSVGKRLRDLAEIGLLRRIRLKRAGRRTVDFLILKRSPLFGASLDDLAEHLPAGCVPMPETESAEPDAPASVGSVDEENPAVERNICGPASPQDAGASNPSTLPQLAADAPATVREPIEPLYEPRVPPKAPPARGGAQGPAKEGMVELIGFATFWNQYPDHETDNRRKAAAAFAALTERDREAAIERVGRYAEQIAKTARRPVGAWRWLQERRFTEYGPGAVPGRPQRWFVPEASEPWKAACALGMVATAGAELRVPKLWAVRGPDGIAGAYVPIALMDNWQPWIVPFEQWVFVEFGTPQAGRWFERLRDLLGHAPTPRTSPPFDASGTRQHRLISADGEGWKKREYRGLLVPIEWPPAKNPKPVSTGPPASLTHEDSDVVANF